MIQLTATALPMLAGLVLMLLTAGWTLLLRRRGAELIPMAVFFASSSASLLALLLEFTVIAEWRAYAVYLEYPLIAGALCALAIAAYARPAPAAGREQRLIRGVAMTLAVVTTLYAVVLVASRTPYELSRASDLHMQVLMIVVLAAFLFTLVALVRGVQLHAADAGSGGWQALRAPPTRLARLWRNLALALMIPIMLGIATFLRTLEILSSIGLYLVLGLGVVLFVGALTVSLASAWRGDWPIAARTRLWVATVVLVLWGCTTAVVGRAFERSVTAAYIADALTIRALMYQRAASGSALQVEDLPARIAYLWRRHPDRALIVSREPDLSLLALLDDRAAADHKSTGRMVSALLRNNPVLSRDQALVQRPAIRTGTVRRHEVFLGQSQPRYETISFGLGGAFYEAGFNYQAKRQEIHAALLPFALGTIALGLLLGGEALIAAYRGRRG